MALTELTHTEETPDDEILAKMDKDWYEVDGKLMVDDGAVAVEETVMGAGEKTEGETVMGAGEKTEGETAMGAGEAVPVPLAEGLKCWDRVNGFSFRKFPEG